MSNKKLMKISEDVIELLKVTKDNNTIPIRDYCDDNYITVDELLIEYKYFIICN